MARAHAGDARGMGQNCHVPWLFLAVAVVGAWFTANALWPTRRWQLLALSFFAGWMTGELAIWHIAWQALATLVFVRLGALDAWPGWLGLGITLASWAGLLWLIAVSTRASAIVEHALVDGLGDDYEEQITGRRPTRVARRTIARQLALPLVLRDRRVERIKNLRYAEGGGRRHLLDVWRPKHSTESGADRAPVLLQIHGGAWVVGDKGQQGLPLMLHLAAEGWVCVAINYRLSPRARFPDHLVDCKLALAWIRDHIAEFGGDPDFVVVTGGSAGAHLAMLTALTPNDPRFQEGFEDVDTSVQGCVPFYGPTDLVDLFRVEQRSGTRLRNNMTQWLMGATPEEAPSAWEDASPVTQVRADAPPFFVVHGTNDNLVPVRQARAFVAALRAESREPVCYAEIPGASHAFEVFHSVRTGIVVNGVDRFLAWLESTQKRDEMAPLTSPAQPPE